MTYIFTTCSIILYFNLSEEPSAPSSMSVSFFFRCKLQLPRTAHCALCNITADALHCSLRSNCSHFYHTALEELKNWYKIPVTFLPFHNHQGARGGAIGWGTALQAGRSRVRFPMVTFEFVIDIKSFRSYYGPGVDSASNRNEYQEYFLGGKGGRCVGLTTLPHSCADCLDIWEPQSPGTLRACPGL